MHTSDRLGSFPRYDAESYLFFEEDFFRGTLPPAFRASDNPIAIACFLLVTFLPDRPLFRVPSFRSCIAFSTLSDAFLPYLAMILPPSVVGRLKKTCINDNKNRFGIYVRLKLRSSAILRLWQPDWGRFDRNS